MTRLMRYPERPQPRRNLSEIPERDNREGTREQVSNVISSKRFSPEDTADLPSYRFVPDLSRMTPERAAMLLALSLSREEEEALKREFERNGHFKCAVTEVGAKLPLFREKIIPAVMGASLNCGVISKTPQHVHALIHATLEAVEGFTGSVLLSGDLAAKIGIVRDSQWIAVALFGESADHGLINHKRSGLGVMHISY